MRSQPSFHAASAGPRRRRVLWRALSAWVVTVGVVAVAGSVVQTQFNLLALVRMGVSVPWELWLRTTGQDLLGFAPNFAMLVGVALALGLPVASWLGRRFGGRSIWLPLAGGAAMATVLGLLNALLPVTPIAATRETAGMLALIGVGALGGGVFALLTRVDPE